MMNYYLNKNINKHYGKFIVHREACPHLPKPDQRHYLGNWKSCQEAMRVAKNYKNNRIDGCRECNTDCHTGYYN